MAISDCFFEDAHQVWDSVAKEVGGQEAECWGWGGRWQKLNNIGPSQTELTL